MNDSGTDTYFSAETVPILGAGSELGNRPGYIYFVTDGEAIKIGISGDPLGRIKNMQTGSPRELRLLAAIAGSEAAETELHRKFAHLNVRGEWFIDKLGEIARYIASFKPKKPKPTPAPWVDQPFPGFPCGETAREFGRFLHEDAFNMADDVWRAAYRVWLSLRCKDQPAFAQSAAMQREHALDMAAFVKLWPAHMASHGV